MTKPTKPNINFPEGFAIEGQKTDFLDEQIQNGFDPVDPDVLAGDNLNKLIDDTYKGLHYSMDGVNDLYKGAVLYDETETYTNKSIVFNIDENGNAAVYQSLVNDNTGNALTDGTNWQKIEPCLKDRVTNCISELPKGVEYELADGTLTIKAGSILQVPYGVEDLTSTYPVGATFLNDNFKVVDTQYAYNKFHVWVEVQTDITYSKISTTTSKYYFAISITGNQGLVLRTGISGTSAPTSELVLYYNTNTNLVSFTEEHSTTPETDVVSLPLFEGQSDGEYSLGSIDNIYNPVSYIGSTCFMNKGVKILAPAGRNENGTLKNVEYKLGTAYTFNAPSTDTYYLYLNATSGSIRMCWIQSTFISNEKPVLLSGTTNAMWINPQTNEIKVSNDGGASWEEFTAAKVGIIKSGVVKSDEPVELLKQTDGKKISGLSMPSETSVALTLGASGSEYTSPANGYFYCQVTNSGAVGHYYLTATLSDKEDNFLMTSRCNTYAPNTTSDYSNQVIIPARQGQKVTITYTNNNRQTTKTLRFIYAQGEVE